MQTKTLQLLALLLFCLPLLAAAASPEKPAGDELIAGEIRNLATSVDRLTQLLSDQAQQQRQDTTLRKLDIAVDYLNFRSRRIEMLEHDLSSSRTLKRNLEDVIRQWEKRVEELEEEANTGVPTFNGDNPPLAEAQDRLKMFKQRLTRTDAQIIDEENRLSELRNQLDSVEDYVEKHLEL